MSHFAYIGVLIFCLIGTGWLELAMRTHVYRRWHRLLLAVVPVVLLFTLWDKYAISQGHWTFDFNHISTITVWQSIPLDEILFFIVIPICAILTLEGVRSAHGDIVGDERSLTSDDPAGAQSHFDGPAQ
jgi:lycopene cyclase domain-containing protein